jgi:hypothetical protein
MASLLSSSRQDMEAGVTTGKAEGQGPGPPVFS